MQAPASAPTSIEQIRAELNAIDASPALIAFDLAFCRIEIAGLRLRVAQLEAELAGQPVPDALPDEAPVE